MPPETPEEVREQYSEGVLEQAAEATGATVEEIIEARLIHHTQCTPRQKNLRQEAQRQQKEWVSENLDFESK